MDEIEKKKLQDAIEVIRENLNLMYEGTERNNLATMLIIMEKRSNDN